MKMKESKTANQIRQLMNDINNNATDTYWISDHETIFERLWFIYISHESNDFLLKQDFPEYC